MCLISCAASISLANVIGEDTTQGAFVGEPTVEGWIPVLLAVFTPILFVSSGITIKQLCSRQGFDAFKVQFLSYSIVGLILFGFLLSRLNEPDFSKELLGVGTFGSIFNTIGIAIMGKACSVGPIGPINALNNISTVLFSLITAIRLRVVPKPLEFVGMFIGLIGACILTISEHLIRLWNYIMCKKAEKKLRD